MRFGKEENIVLNTSMSFVESVTSWQTMSKKERWIQIVMKGYFTNSSGYMVYKKHTNTMMESINVVIDDTFEDKQEDEDDVPHKECDIESERTNSENSQINKGLSIRIQKDHSIKNGIGNLNERVITRSIEMVANLCFISKVEPKNIKEL